MTTRTSRCCLSVVRGPKLRRGSYYPMGLYGTSMCIQTRQCPKYLAEEIHTIFEQVLLNYHVIFIVRVACGSAGHHRHCGVISNETRITCQAISGAGRSEKISKESAGQKADAVWLTAMSDCWSRPSWHPSSQKGGLWLGGFCTATSSWLRLRLPPASSCVSRLCATFSMVVGHYVSVGRAFPFMPSQS